MHPHGSPRNVGIASPGRRESILPAHVPARVSRRVLLWKTTLRYRGSRLIAAAIVVSLGHEELAGGGIDCGLHRPGVRGE